MKKIILLLCFAVGLSNVKAQGIYFQAQVKKSASGTSLEFYIRPNLSGGNITLKFDNLDFFVRWPSAEAAPITGTPVVNTADFPGLTITQQTSDDPYGSEPGFVIREWTSPATNSTSTVVTYVAGQEYLVFSVPVTNAISSNIELAGNNEDGVPHYFSATKNSSLGGQSDFTSHNSTNGDPNNQLYYGNAAFLSRSGQNFYQKITAGVLPVKFTSFTANKKDDNGFLNWTVANETATVDHYEIERSLDGIVFNKINAFSKTYSLNNSNNYKYIDQNISTLKGNGIIYYRIKQVDIDARFVNSEIRNIKISDKNLIITVYPNPVKENTVLEIDAPTNAAVRISLLSNKGNILQSSTIQTVKGINTKQVSMNNYSKGIYLLKVVMGTNVQTIKIIKE